MKRITVIFISVLVLSGCSINPDARRIFIAHRGVNMHYEAAGENSLEAIRLARRAGFKAIETDVRLSSDSVLVVMHDQTLSRTCLNPDGSLVDKSFKVADFPISRLKSSFVLRTSKGDLKTQIPTLEEYLKVCREENMLVFIEPKLNDPTGKHYLDIIACADSICGRENYIITSNNFANSVIRDSLHINDVTLMGILYQTSYEDISSRQNIIIAVSTSRFNHDDYAANIALAKSDGLMTESHADKFEHLDMINNADVDYVSSDFLAPDWHGQGRLLFAVSGCGYNGIRRSVRKCSESCEIVFGAIWLEMEFRGEAKVELGNQEFVVSSSDWRKIRHQVLLSEACPHFKIAEQTPDFKVRRIMVRVAEF